MLSSTGEYRTPSRLPPHQYQSPRYSPTPSTNISSLGLISRIVSPARCAARCQSRSPPQSQQAPFSPNAVWLVAEVHTDHSRIVRVSRRQACPIGDPGGFWELRREPQTVLLWPASRLRAVVVQNDLQAHRFRSDDDLVEYLHGRQPYQVLIDGTV